MDQNQISALGTVIDLSANLLGVSLTLVALIPTLVELVRTRAPDFISRMERENALNRVMIALASTVVMFSLSLGSGLAGMFCNWLGFLWIGLGAFVMSLITIVFITLYTAATLRNVM